MGPARTQSWASRRHAAALRGIGRRHKAKPGTSRSLHPYEVIQLPDKAEKAGAGELRRRRADELPTHRFAPSFFFFCHSARLGEFLYSSAFHELPNLAVSSTHDMTGGSK